MTAWRAATESSPAPTSRWSFRWVMDRTGAFRHTASPRASATRRAIEPAPPSTMFSWAPFSMEKRVSMLPWPRTRNSRWRNDVSFKSPVNRPRTAISKRSRAIFVLMWVRSSHHATERESHSAACLAVQGASSGTRLARRLSLAWVRAMVAMASGLIFGMRPV